VSKNKKRIKPYCKWIWWRFSRNCRRLRYGFKFFIDRLNINFRFGVLKKALLPLFFLHSPRDFFLIAFWTIKESAGERTQKPDSQASLSHFTLIFSSSYSFHHHLRFIHSFFALFHTRLPPARHMNCRSLLSNQLPSVFMYVLKVNENKSSIHAASLQSTIS
jgi:hypothetical protein